MKNLFSILGLTLATGVGTAGFVGNADARAIGGASAPTLVDCIDRSLGDYFNACGSTKGGLFSLPVQFTGAKAITVFGSAPSASGLSCQAVSRNSNTGLSQQTGFQSLPAAGQSSIALPSVNLNGGGYIYVKCNLASSAAVNDIVYND
jgi:hypothetical protein